MAAGPTARSIAAADLVIATAAVGPVVIIRTNLTIIIRIVECSAATAHPADLAD